jgi:hypothetical protein
VTESTRDKGWMAAWIMIGITVAANAASVARDFFPDKAKTAAEGAVTATQNAYTTEQINRLNTTTSQLTVAVTALSVQIAQLPSAAKVDALSDRVNKIDSAESNLDGRVGALEHPQWRNPH